MNTKRGNLSKDYDSASLMLAKTSLASDLEFNMTCVAQSIFYSTGFYGTTVSFILLLFVYWNFM